jgi:hypothetical protein
VPRTLNSPGNCDAIREVTKPLQPGQVLEIQEALTGSCRDVERSVEEELD